MPVSTMIVTARPRRSSAVRAPVRTLLLHGPGAAASSWDAFAALAAPSLELWDAELPWDGGCELPARLGRVCASVEGGADIVVAHCLAANLLLELLSGTCAPVPSAVVLVAPFHRPHARAAAARNTAARGRPGWLRLVDAYLSEPAPPLDGLGLPVLVLSGAQDTAARPADGLALAAALPDSRARVMDGCGHFPMAERPGLFADLVNGFAARVTGQT
ncbi:hypothetical protein Afil01_38840 [Actinorhabdospora filicis]|uniref:Alpha/beta hydrolase n=1 Tax=Actinorhabdospora filicis TaxID=1785913 RepID=A0A9W6SNE1_9ACTN|nr:alpha/beta hydrolase [Actinorhabdospora filicis]GLZ79077.1 hypothetical protein Afil01_38840 [Actinorhabdospora filicis]